MADLKKSLTDVGLQFLRDLLNPGAAAGKAPVNPAKTSIDDLSPEDLSKEKIRLDQETRKLLARLREVEAEKKKLFEEGVRNAGEREQRVIARRIKEKDAEAANMDLMLQVVSKQMRIVNGLIQVKERASVMSTSGIASVLKNVDLKDLVSYIEKTSVDGEYNDSNFNKLLHALEESNSLSPDYKEEDDVMDIMKAMQQAREASDSPEVLEKQFDEMNKQIKQKQQDKLQERSEEDF